MATALITFMDVAFRKKGSLSLSYTHKKVKWFVRDHALSLLHEFPSLNLSVNPFAYNDGTIVNLFNVNGVLPLPSSTIYLTIWLHQSYPFVCPLVYLFSPSGNPILHPYVDASTGLVSSAYLLMWDDASSNLSECVRNLVKIFKFWPPFDHSESRTSNFVRVSSVPSKREAVDRLALSILHDVTIFKTMAKEEIENISIVQSSLNERAVLSSSVMSDLEKEIRITKNRAGEMRTQNEQLLKWLEEKETSALPDDRIEEAFEAAEERSRVVMEHKVAEDAIDDAMRVMELALGKGVVSIDAYLKQVRILAREQFYHRFVETKAMGESRPNRIRY